MSVDLHVLKAVTDQTLSWSKAHNYLEWTKHDALNSPILSSLCGKHRIPRILATQAVMRFPINLRPMLHVRKSENPKGLALFVHTLLDLFSTTQDMSYLGEAERILDRLLTLRSPGNWHGNCWGYQYPWQDLGFFAPAGMPNAVVTAFVCEAFLHAYRITVKEAYLDPVISAVSFFLNDLVVLKDNADELCLSYMPVPMTMRVMDVSILIAAVLAQLARIHDDEDLKLVALRLARYVVNRQTFEGAWYYTDPPTDSPLKIDNYHTGFILDALYRVVRETGQDTWLSRYHLGVSYYATMLFNKDGTPRWTSCQNYPHDIHGAAQGILTLGALQNRAQHAELVDKLIHWTLNRMYHPDGFFYYQETRLFRKKMNFLRWCNGWMCHALSQFLLAAHHEKD